MLEQYVAAVARRREQLTAVVTAAVPLDDTQRHRLAQALSGIYGKPVQVNVILDPEVVGGIRVQVGERGRRRHDPAPARGGPAVARRLTAGHRPHDGARRSTTARLHHTSTVHESPRSERAELEEKRH